MIEVKHLYKSFEDKDVLKDINTVFHTGKTNLIIGQSGSGKTVLMKCLVGLLRPEQGELLYDGRDIVKMNKKERKKLRTEMGMLFQSAALFDSMTVLENVMFPLDMFSNMTVRDRIRRAMFCLDRVNLTDAKKKYPSEIRTSLVIDDLIHSITHEFQMTTIINTHDMNSVMGIGENIAFINHGVKDWEGTSKDVFTSDSESLNEFVFASDLFKKIRQAELASREK